MRCGGSLWGLLQLAQAEREQLGDGVGAGQLGPRSETQLFEDDLSNSAAFNHSERLFQFGGGDDPFLMDFSSRIRGKSDEFEFIGFVHLRVSAYGQIALAGFSAGGRRRSAELKGRIDSSFALA